MTPVQIDIGPNLKELLETLVGLAVVAFLWFLMWRD